MLPWLLIAGAGALYALLSRRRFEPSAPMGPVTLHAGVPYRLAIRSQTGSGTAEALSRVQNEIKSRILGTTGASAPTFLAIDTPPPWAPAGTQGWGRLLTIFDVTPATAQQTSVGRAIDGLGTIEWMLRLDGRSFGDPP